MATAASVTPASTAPAAATLQAADCVKAATIKAVQPSGALISTVKVKEKFAVVATVTLDGRINPDEVRGVVYAMSNRPGRHVVMQSAGWIGRRTGPGEYSGESILDFQARAYYPTIVLLVGKEKVAQYSMKITP